MKRRSSKESVVVDISCIKKASGEGCSFSIRLPNAKPPNRKQKEGKQAFEKSFQNTSIILLTSLMKIAFVLHLLLFFLVHVLIVRQTFCIVLAAFFFFRGLQDQSLTNIIVPLIVMLSAFVVKFYWSSSPKEAFYIYFLSVN